MTPISNWAKRYFKPSYDDVDVTAEDNGWEKDPKEFNFGQMNTMLSWNLPITGRKQGDNLQKDAIISCSIGSGYLEIQQEIEYSSFSLDVSQSSCVEG